MMRLAQRLIRPGESPSDQPVRKRLGTFASAVGIGTNILLSLTKVIIGTLTGSLAVTADAVNNLSDAAGSALADIDRVTRELSELIARISQQALQEAQSANVVAANIQHIFAVTEQTGDGTRSTAQMVRELSRSAEELKQSVSRFKVA